MKRALINVCTAMVFECENCGCNSIIFDDARSGDPVDCPRCKKKYKIGDITGEYRAGEKNEQVDAQLYQTF